jgi:hypothetical protein
VATRCRVWRNAGWAISSSTNRVWMPDTR